VTSPPRISHLHKSEGDPHTNLHYGKGEGTKSDIDYAVRRDNSSGPIETETDYPLLLSLPGLDLTHGIEAAPISALPRILTPHQPPAYLPPGTPNPY
jgi:hypothetical protein